MHDAARSPSARFDSGFAASPLVREVLADGADGFYLFGGEVDQDGERRYSNEFFSGGVVSGVEMGTGGDWTLMEPTEDLPAPRKDSSAAFVTPPLLSDCMRDCNGGHAMSGFVVLGGMTKVNADAEVLGDVWFANVTTSAQKHVDWMELRARDASMADRLVREGHTSLFHCEEQRIVVFGGRGEDGQGKNDLLSIAVNASALPFFEVEALHDGSHSTGDAPSPRLWTPMIYVETAGSPSMVQYCVFGGLDTIDNRPANDLWCFLPDNGIWKRLDQKGDIPSRRSGHHMFFDAASEHIVLFGGEDVEGDGLNDVYVFDLKTSKWTRVAEIDEQANAPTGRLGAAVTQLKWASKSRDNISFVVFGGLTGWNKNKAYLEDLWRGEISLDQVEPPEDSPGNGGNVLSFQSVLITLVVLVSFFL